MEQNFVGTCSDKSNLRAIGERIAVVTPFVNDLCVLVVKHVTFHLIFAYKYLILVPVGNNQLDNGGRRIRVLRVLLAFNF